MLKFRLPSPALVISMMALALVLGGTAVAATVGDPDAKADTKLVKKLAPTLTVKGAATVGGQWIKTFAKTVADGDGTQNPVFSAGGISLTLSCATGEPTVQVTSAVDHALMRGTETFLAQDAVMGTSSAAAGTAYTVFSASDKRGTIDLHYVRTDGHHVDIDAVIDDKLTINGFDGCLVEGTAIGA